jgi:type II secretory pathway component GspD/PulD (secretin)
VVTRILITASVEAPFLVPILRPLLLPQAAHFAAMTPNRQIMVDRYAHVQRIAAIVKPLDRPGVGRARE